MNQNRREFLENSLFAATAAALAGTANTVHAEDKEDKSSSSPNERKRVCVIGVNGRGGSHIGGLGGRKDCEIGILCDIDESVGGRKVADLQKKGNKNVRFEKDLRKVMEDKSIDIVSIATPNHWHALAAIWAVQAGKDVYVEKPVSHNVSEGRRIVQAAEKYNRIVQTGTQCRSMPGTQEAIKFVQSGGVGEVRLARGLCYKPRGSIGPKGNYDVPANVDYDIWLGPAPMKPLTRKRFHYDWHWQWDYGNGDLGNQGIHQMDLARWGLGVTDLGEKVVSYGGRLGYIDAGETANTQISIHDYDNKRLVFEVRGLRTNDLRGAKVGVIFYGSDGYVVLNTYTGGAAFDKDGKMIKKFSGGGDHFGNFVDAVHSRDASSLNAHIEEGHLSSALCHLGNISYRLGETVSMAEAEERVKDKGGEGRATFARVADHIKNNNVKLEETPMHYGVELTLKGEEFTGEGSEKATPMLTREYRKGFEVPTADKL